MKPQRQRSSTSVAVSIALHLVLGLGLARALTFGPFDGLFSDESPSVPVERIGFVALPQAGPAQAGISGGDGRPERPKHAQPPLVAPTVIPTGIPPLSSTPAPPVDDGGSGPIVGKGGPLAGIRPTFSEPRVWVPPAELVTAPKTLPERLDSALQSKLRQHEDSLRLAGAGAYAKKPGDWSWEKNGKKYGWNENGIQWGDKHIPAPLLPRLASNVALNPAAREAQQLDRLMSETREQAQRNMNEAEFRAAVKSIRERKERERKAAEAQVAGSQ